MGMVTRSAVAGVGLVLALCCRAAAGFSIELLPASGAHPVGAPFSLAVVLTGLSAEDEFLTAYDLAIGFGPGLTFLGATSTAALGTSVFLATPSATGANLFEASFEPDSFFASQADTLTVANLQLAGTLTGPYDVSLTANALAGSQIADPNNPDGPTISRDLLRTLDHSVLGASVDIVPGTVPEPATPWLVALAGIAALYLRRPQH